MTQEAKPSAQRSRATPVSTIHIQAMNFIIVAASSLPAFLLYTTLVIYENLAVIIPSVYVRFVDTVNSSVFRLQRLSITVSPLVLGLKRLLLRVADLRKPGGCHSLGTCQVCGHHQFISIPNAEIVSGGQLVSIATEEVVT